MITRPTHDVDAIDYSAPLQALQAIQGRRDIEVDGVEHDLADAQVCDSVRVAHQLERCNTADETNIDQLAGSLCTAHFLTITLSPSVPDLS